MYVYAWWCVLMITDNKKDSKNFYWLIYSNLSNNVQIPQIVRSSGVCKQRLNYYVSHLKQLKIIERVHKTNTLLGLKICKTLTKGQLGAELDKFKLNRKKKFSIGATVKKPDSNLHALNMKIPILKGVINDTDWEIKEKLNNWIPKYKSLSILGGIKFKNNNNKSIMVYVMSRDFGRMDEVFNLSFQVRAFCHEYFKKKHNVILDILNCETKNLNLATQDKHSESMLKKGEVFELDLATKCEKIFPKDDRDAKAWLDGSPYSFTAETNDTEWKRCYLQMPFNIRDMRNNMNLMQEYNINLKLHIEVQQQQLITQKKTQKILEKMERFFN